MKSAGLRRDQVDGPHPTPLTPGGAILVAEADALGLEMSTGQSGDLIAVFAARYALGIVTSRGLAAYLSVDDWEPS